MKLIIGREDKADFPEFNLENIAIKIDSGAYTSSLSCCNIEETIKDGEKVLKYNVLDKKHEQYKSEAFFTKFYDLKKVKSSNGIVEERYRIKTEIIIFNERFNIYLTLTERKKMKFPVLLGRKFLNKKFVIDTAKKNISHKLKYKNT
ncbi:RimK/LysX family protein [uncultured Polaribacter sp.]|uniref:ATP-dependent zinc protease family protein n=1 Tax=uncultured Polaribacter sp. TaxID=174711 RepID=UPI002602A8A2|nr:RimK/LysX family protein [uncultured Polaribacter sp.]